MRRKEYIKIKATCNHSNKYVLAICEKSKEEEMRKRCIKALVDYCDMTKEDYAINVYVEDTKELPEQGTDLFIKPKEPVFYEPEDKIDVIDL